MAGAVLGIDVGYSASRRTTCFCLLTWSENAVAASFRRVTSNPDARKAALQALLPDPPRLLAVAIDGPLLPQLQPGLAYRAAEALLSQGLLQKRGKPGQTSSPVGLQLNRHATTLAELVLIAATISEATHADPIHPARVVEAFPNIFLAALLDEADLPSLSRNATDRYWDCCASAQLPALLSLLLPARTPQFSVSSIEHHDDRAGLVCALTALSVAAGSHVAVGAARDGDIMLPPAGVWGRDASGQAWLARELTGALRTWARSTRRTDARVVGCPVASHASVVV